MHPKTFSILLRPFQALGDTSSYTFFIHADSAQEARNWVARVFDGVVQCERGEPEAGPLMALDGDHLSLAEVADSLYRVFRKLQADRVQFLEAAETQARCYSKTGDLEQHARRQALEDAAGTAWRWQKGVFTECAALHDEIQRNQRVASR